MCHIILVSVKMIKGETRFLFLLRMCKYTYFRAVKAFWKLFELMMGKNLVRNFYFLPIPRRPDSQMAARLHSESEISRQKPECAAIDRPSPCAEAARHARDNKLPCYQIQLVSMIDNMRRVLCQCYWKFKRKKSKCKINLFMQSYTSKYVRNLFGQLKFENRNIRYF